MLQLTKVIMIDEIELIPKIKVCFFFPEKLIRKIKTSFDSSLEAFNIQLRFIVRHLTLVELVDISPRKFSTNFNFIIFISDECLPRTYDN
jgi:hypothetical protein